VCMRVELKGCKSLKPGKHFRFSSASLSSF